MVKETIKSEKTHSVSLFRENPPNASNPADFTRLEALINGQGQVLAMVTQRASLASILEALIRWVEEQSQNELLASILLLDGDGKHLRHGSAPSLPTAYNTAIDGIEIGLNVGSCGTAAFTKQAIIAEDVATDTRWEDYRELALQYGLCACWSTPLIGRLGNVLGTFAMYYRQPRTPTQDDFQLIQLITHTAVIAIEHQQAEEERDQLLAREQKALAQVKAERQIYYDLFMQAPAIIAVLRGPEHRYELANPLYMQIVGQQRSIIGRPIREALPELAGQGIFEFLDHVYQTGEPFIGNEIEVKLDRADNGTLEAVYFNFVYQPAYNGQKKIDGILIHAVDITEQVKTRQAGEKSQANLAFLADASKILSSSLNYQDILKHIARLSIPLLADFCVFDILTEENTIQRVTWEHVDPKLKDYLQIVKKFTPAIDYVANPVALSLRYEKHSFIPSIDDAWMQLASTSPEHLEFMRTIGYQSLITIPLTIRGKVIGTLTFIFTKDSQRHHTEDDLHLAEEVGTRAAIAVENSRLYQKSQEEIEVRKKLEEQKDEFMSVASHELKTPVTSIKAYVQLLDRRFRKMGDGHSSGLVKKMDIQLNKLTHLIGDLLDVTKIQGGKLQFHEDLFDFTCLVEEVVEEMQRTTDKHTILTDLAQTHTIYGDRDRVGQVITNLISNAIKYSPDATQIIVKSSWQHDSVTFSVQDFGVGIPEDKKERVFERFFRVDGESQATFPGLGLGLYISAEIVTRHNGTIQVESAKDEGSTFSFSLPLKRSLGEQTEEVTK